MLLEHRSYPWPFALPGVNIIHKLSVLNEGRKGTPFCRSMSRTDIVRYSGAVHADRRFTAGCPAGVMGFICCTPVFGRSFLQLNCIYWHNELSYLWQSCRASMFAWANRCRCWPSGMWLVCLEPEIGWKDAKRLVALSKLSIWTGSNRMSRFSGDRICFVFGESRFRFLASTYVIKIEVTIISFSKYAVRQVLSFLEQAIYNKHYFIPQ